MPQVLLLRIGSLKLLVYLKLIRRCVPFMAGTGIFGTVWAQWQQQRLKAEKRFQKPSALELLQSFDIQIETY